MCSYTTEKLELKHPSGLTVRGIHNVPECGGKRPAVIICHGFNSCYADQLRQGAAFAEAGIDSYLFDFCGGGARTTSDGKLSEMMTLDTECADLKLVVDYVRARESTDALFLMGESQGGLISVMTAQKYPDLFRGLLLWFPALIIPDASRERFLKNDPTVFGIQLSPDFDRLAMQVDPWKAMPDYAGQVLLLHGDRDPVVPLDVSQKAEKLFPHAKLYVIKGAGHGFGGDDLSFALEKSIGMIKESAHVLA